MFFFLGHLNHSSDLLPSVFVCHVVRQFQTFKTFLTSSLEPLNQFQPNLAYSIYGWRVVKLVKFMAPETPPPHPWAWGVGLKPSKFMQSLKNVLLYAWISSSRTAGMIVINIELSTKIVKFIAPVSGVLALGLGSNDYIVKIH